jgi:hypothetical protein
MVSMSLKEYYDNIYSGVSIFTDTWGWFVDIDINHNDFCKNNINNINNINKINFISNKIQNYRSNVQQLYRNVTASNTQYKKKVPHIISRPSISSKLSDLELQFKMNEDTDEFYEKDISENSIYNKLLKGVCFIIIFGLIVG